MYEKWRYTLIYNINRNENSFREKSNHKYFVISDYKVVALLTVNRLTHKWFQIQLVKIYFCNQSFLPRTTVI